MTLLRTYTTLDGRVLDLSELPEPLVDYLRLCIEIWRAGDVDWETFGNEYLYSGRNPLLADTDGRVARWVLDHPLYRALLDVDGRIGIRCGRFTEEGDVHSDPLADSAIPAAEAARLKGVTPAAIHRAVARGALVGHSADGPRRALFVSQRSLERWAADTTRQRAGRAAASARSRASS